MTRDALEDRVRRFLDAFNRDDLPGVMAFFRDDGVYEEFHRARHAGRTAVEAAFVPQFRGDFGRLRFRVEDLFVDAESGKALVSWACESERAGRSAAWRGLDVLWFDEAGLLRHKSTYAKTRSPLLVPGA